MQETAVQLTGVWEVDTRRYEKWINRARGEKFYRAVFINKAIRTARFSKTKFKTASDALEWAYRFKRRFA